MCSLPCSTLFPYTTLFRSLHCADDALRGGEVPARRPCRQVDPGVRGNEDRRARRDARGSVAAAPDADPRRDDPYERRSEEHTSALQSRQYLVWRLLLANKK